MVKEAIRGVLRRRGLELIPAVNLYEWQLKPGTGLVHNASSELPDGARRYLRSDHPRLLRTGTALRRLRSSGNYPIRLAGRLRA